MGRNTSRRTKEPIASYTSGLQVTGARKRSSVQTQKTTYANHARKAFRSRKRAADSYPGGHTHVHIGIGAAIMYPKHTAPNIPTSGHQAGLHRFINRSVRTYWLSGGPRISGTLQVGATDRYMVRDSFGDAKASKFGVEPNSRALSAINQAENPSFKALNTQATGLS